MLAGFLDYTERENFYTNDYKVFYRNKEMSEQIEVVDVSDWAILLNSPWSQNDIKWTIKSNNESPYEAIKKSEPAFKCTYSIVGYDAIIAGFIGYGNTPEDAFTNCMVYYKHLESKYNKDNLKI